MVIGHLASAYQRLMQAETDVVRFHPGLAAKLRFKHRMDWKEFRIMPLAFRFGTCISDRGRTVSFLYEERLIYRKTYHLAVKTTGRGHELWVATFYPIAPSEVRRRMKKALILYRQAP